MEQDIESDSDDVSMCSCCSQHLLRSPPFLWQNSFDIGGCKVDSQVVLRRSTAPLSSNPSKSKSSWSMQFCSQEWKLQLKMEIFRQQFAIVWQLDMQTLRSYFGCLGYRSIICRTSIGLWHCTAGHGQNRCSVTHSAAGSHWRIYSPVWEGWWHETSTDCVEVARLRFVYFDSLVFWPRNLFPVHTLLGCTLDEVLHWVEAEMQRRFEPR